MLHQVLKNIKGAVDARMSVTHSATILANALMHAGTSIDTFLRENLEWLSRATNWAKFSATAGLGVIHRGQLQQGEHLVAVFGLFNTHCLLLCYWGTISKLTGWLFIKVHSGSTRGFCLVGPAFGC